MKAVLNHSSVEANVGRISRPLALLLLSFGLVDMPGTWKFGGISIMGLGTIACAILGVCWICIHFSIFRESLKFVWPLHLFLLWIVASALLHGLGFAGTQNIVLLIAFTALIIVTARKRTPDEIGVACGAVIKISAALSGLLLLAPFFLKGTNADLLMGPRSFGMYALFAVAWYASAWRYGGLRSFLLAALFVFLIGLSLSRTAFAAGVILLIVAKLRMRSSKDAVWILSIGLLVAALGYYFVVHFPPLRDRFLGTASMGDLIVQPDLLNDSGRWSLWIVTVDSYLQSPWIGQGPGSSDELTQDLLDLDHPHCDYLRVLHDFGAIGLCLFVFAIGSLLRCCWRAWRIAEEASNDSANVHCAAVLAFVAMLLNMATDNNLTYFFCMGPLAVLIGLSVRKLTQQGIPFASRPLGGG